MSLIVALLLLLAAPVQDEVQDDAQIDSAWHEMRLENGIGVFHLDAPLASQHAFFTMLPLGLLDDETDRAQFAHLVEHLIVRSTDPDSLESEGLVLNGETTGLALRLETFVDAPEWKRALDRHARWLTAQDVDPVILAREKESISAEEASTQTGGYTHKWALSAWNQVVRHGASHVGLHADIAGVSLEDVQDYMQRRLRSGPDVLVVSVGPIAAEEIAGAVTEKLGGLPSEPWAMSAPAAGVEAVQTVQDRMATWDLSARHYMEWYPVPSATALDRIQADALALLLNVKIQQRASLQSLGVQVLAQADLVSPEGRWLLLSASMAPGVDVELLKGELAALRESLTEGRDMDIMVEQLKRQLTLLPDFEAVREQLGDHPAAPWIEAQQMMFLVYAQLNMGLNRAEMAAAYPALTTVDVLAFADALFKPSARSTLVLEPAD